MASKDKKETKEEHDSGHTSDDRATRCPEEDDQAQGRKRKEKGKPLRVFACLSPCSTVEYVASDFCSSDEKDDPCTPSHKENRKHCQERRKRRLCWSCCLGKRKKKCQNCSRDCNEFVIEFTTDGKKISSPTVKGGQPCSISVKNNEKDDEDTVIQVCCCKKSDCRSIVDKRKFEEECRRRCEEEWRQKCEEERRQKSEERRKKCEDKKKQEADNADKKSEPKDEKSEPKDEKSEPKDEKSEQEDDNAEPEEKREEKKAKGKRPQDKTDKKKPQTPKEQDETDANSTTTEPAPPSRPSKPTKKKVTVKDEDEEDQPEATSEMSEKTDEEPTPPKGKKPTAKSPSPAKAVSPSPAKKGKPSGKGKSKTTIAAMATGPYYEWKTRKSLERLMTIGSPVFHIFGKGLAEKNKAGDLDGYMELADGYGQNQIWGDDVQAKNKQQAAFPETPTLDQPGHLGEVFINSESSSACSSCEIMKSEEVQKSRFFKETTV